MLLYEWKHLESKMLSKVVEKTTGKHYFIEAILWIMSSLNYEIRNSRLPFINCIIDQVTFSSGPHLLTYNITIILL